MPSHLLILIEQLDSVPSCSKLGYRKSKFNRNPCLKFSLKLKKKLNSLFELEMYQGLFGEVLKQHLYLMQGNLIIVFSTTEPENVAALISDISPPEPRHFHISNACEDGILLLRARSLHPWR